MKNYMNISKKILKKKSMMKMVFIQELMINMILMVLIEMAIIKIPKIYMILMILIAMAFME